MLGTADRPAHRAIGTRTADVWTAGSPTAGSAHASLDAPSEVNPRGPAPFVTHALGTLRA